MKKTISGSTSTEPTTGNRADTSAVAMKPIRIVVLGLCGVGKTSLIRTLKTSSKKGLGLKNRSPVIRSSVYVPTEDPYYPHQMKIGGHDVEILDTAGISRFPLMRNFSIRTGDAFVLVFSVEDMSSFDQIAAIRREILDLHGDTVPIVVVGNKTDTVLRQVPMELADCIVSIEWEHAYHEVSAKDGKAVRSVFKNLAKSMSLQAKMRHLPKRRRSGSLPIITLLRPGSDK